MTSPTPSPNRSPRATRVPWAAFAVDLFVVTMFAIVGRSSHSEGLSLPGVVVTAAPFLAGTVGGWALLVARGAPRPASTLGGIVIWLATLVAGMLLRLVTGLGVALPFVLVAASVTALGLIGWRILGAYLLHRSAP